MCTDDENSPGRPYGGVAIICKVIKGITYELVNCDNQRIIGVLIKDTAGNPVHLIICAYLPYFDGFNQLTEYLECIDAIQALIDDHADRVPIKILGDFNAQLPRTNVLTCNWYKSKGFNYNSRILLLVMILIFPYFITGNDCNWYKSKGFNYMYNSRILLLVMIFIFPYFITGNDFKVLDHVFELDVTYMCILILIYHVI